MKNLFYLLLCLIAGASCSQADPTKPWDKGAFETQKYRNLFAEMGYKQADIDAKLKSVFLDGAFYGQTEDFEVGDSMAYISDVKNHGTSALKVCPTSRALGTYLGSSARPIFTVFKNMEEVQQDMIKSAKALYKEYVNKGLTTEPPFKGVGTQYILFAVNEPKLFQLLFMTEQKQIPDLSGVYIQR